MPPPFPPGSHEVILQSIAPDGTRTRSQSSITVAIAENEGHKAAHRLTTPDKPTVVLSSPQAPAAAGTKPDEPPARTAARPQAQPPASGAAPAVTPTPRPGAPPAAEPVPSEQACARRCASRPSRPRRAAGFSSRGRRLPGATVRLYLNDTLIAPGGAGADGRSPSPSARGVRPGGYRVRLDDVDPVSGEVKSRAEVEFRVPGPLTVELPPAAQPYVTSAPPQPPRRPAETVEATVPPRLRRGTALRDAADGARAGHAGRGPGHGSPLAHPAAATAAAPAPAGEPASASATGAVVIPDINTASVCRGDNLWRISQRIYGRGVRYTVIYGANQDQIRNPNLIYPGQVFVLPPRTRGDAQR